MLKKKDLEQYVQSKWLVALTLRSGINIKNTILPLDEDEIVFRTLAKSGVIPLLDILLVMKTKQKVTHGEDLE